VEEAQALVMEMFVSLGGAKRDKREKRRDAKVPRRRLVSARKKRLREKKEKRRLLPLFNRLGGSVRRFLLFPSVQTRKTQGVDGADQLKAQGFHPLGKGSEGKEREGRATPKTVSEGKKSGARFSHLKKSDALETHEGGEIKRRGNEDQCKKRVYRD